MSSHLVEGSVFFDSDETTAGSKRRNASGSGPHKWIEHYLRVGRFDGAGWQIKREWGGMIVLVGTHRPYITETRDAARLQPEIWFCQDHNPFVCWHE